MSRIVSQSEILKSLSDALVGVIENTSPSVVQVSSGRGCGTGVVWDNEGSIITNSHVVGRAGKLDVTLANGKTLNATLVGRDRFADVAVLNAGYNVNEAVSFRPIERGDSDGLATGQFVLGLANPFGDGITAVSGIITNPKGRLGGPWSDEPLILTDARLNYGYSGGPLIDASGKMIGMNSAFVANRGVAIPIGVLTTVVKEVSSRSSSKIGYLGIISNPISLPSEIAKEVGQSRGLIVLSVEPGSPAKKAGVAVGDIVVKLGSKNVESYYQLRKLLANDVVGRETRLSVLRGEKPTDLSITPVEG